MDEPAVVDVLEPQRRLPAVPGGHRRRQRPAGRDEPAEVRAGDVLHRQVQRTVVGAGADRPHDVGVVEPGDGADLAGEPDLEPVRVHPVGAGHLQRDPLAAVAVPGEEHLPHAALAEPVEQDVGADGELLAAAAGQPPDLERGEPAAADEFGVQVGGVGGAQGLDRDVPFDEEGLIDARIEGDRENHQRPIRIVL